MTCEHRENLWITTRFRDHVIKWVINHKKIEKHRWYKGCLPTLLYFKIKSMCRFSS